MSLHSFVRSCFHHSLFLPKGAGQWSTSLRELTAWREPRQSVTVVHTFSSSTLRRYSGVKFAASSYKLSILLLQTDTPLSGGQTKHTGCCRCDAILSPLVKESSSRFQGQHFRGRGRGRRGRGRGRRRGGHRH